MIVHSKFSTAYNMGLFFVQRAVHIVNKLSPPKSGCCKYIGSLGTIHLWHPQENLSSNCLHASTRNWLSLHLWTSTFRRHEI